jgi:7,8-dihydropterin-6-yl-methyl-4-(beta-D-ribofuranosyl)aminobenzene 5'-phosphate synthase
LGEHGLSILIERENARVLFDAGQGEAFAANARTLNVDLTSLTNVVFSHGHYDHTGGIATLADIPPSAGFAPSIHMHPAALDAKFAREPDGSAKYIGISPKNRDWLLSREKKLHLSCESAEIASGVFTTGEIPERFAEEAVSSRFRLDEQLTRMDLMIDDQSLFVETDSGIVVLLGCCHRGLANTLTRVAELAETEKIAAVIGGTHLRHADEKRLDFTIETVIKFGVRRFVGTHCTGFDSAACLKNAIPDVFSAGFAGMTLNFQ